MSMQKQHHSSDSAFLSNLHILRRRLLKRVTLKRLLLVGWAFPVAMLAPVALVRTFTSFQPVGLVLLLLPAVLAATAVISHIVGLSLKSAARRVDASFALKQRLATALELTGAEVTPPPGLAPVVLAEAVADSQAALSSAAPPLRAVRALAATALSLLLLAALSFVPSCWLPRLLAMNHERKVLTTAERMLTGAAERLHSSAPDLPGTPTTRLRLEIENLAERVGRHVLTSEETRTELDRLCGQLSQPDVSGRNAALENDLRNLQRSRTLKKLANDVRRGDHAAARREARSLRDRFDKDTISSADVKSLRSALTKFSSETNRPGLAEAAEQLQNAFDKTDPYAFSESLKQLVDGLLAAAEEIDFQRKLAHALENELRTIDAMLAGKSTGMPVPSTALQQLLSSESGSVESASSASADASAGNDSVMDRTKLSRRAFDVSPMHAPPGRVSEPVGTYRSYLRRYFQQP